MARWHLNGFLSHQMLSSLLWPKNAFHPDYFSLQFEITKISTPLLGKSWRKLHLKHSIITKRNGKPLQRKYKINDEVIWCTDISHTLLCEWSVGIDCKGKLEKDPAELVQNKFLKWLLGVNKYCNNNVCRAETGRFPMTIAAQCRNFKFWLTLTKNEYKLSQIAYNDIKWEENNAFWSKKKIKSLLE